MPKQKRALAERLWEKVDRSGGKESCWMFTKAKGNMYGTIRYTDEHSRTRPIGAHRAAYFLTYGILSDTLMVLHRCGQKSCCNPRHLYLGDGSQNAHDAINTQGFCPWREKLSDYEVSAIRALHGQYSQQQLATMFQVSRTTISDIVLGKVRPEAGGPIRDTVQRGQWTHCAQGHPLTEDNIKLTNGGKVRRCKICYGHTQREKAKRFAKGHRAQINARRRKLYALKKVNAS